MECLVRHQEFADPTMLDNMDGFVYAEMELNLKSAKKNKFLPGIKGTPLLPNQFEIVNNDKKIGIFCKKPEDIEKAKQLGAAVVGNTDLVKQVKDGVVTKDDIDVFLATPDVMEDILSLRAALGRDKFPDKKKNTVGSDLEALWTLFAKGIYYSSVKQSDAIGKVQVPLGQLNMPLEELEANFNAYVEEMCAGRAKALGPLIMEVTLVAPPSPERFLLKVEDYVPGHEKKTSQKQQQQQQQQQQQEEESDSEDEEDSQISNKGR